jgi:hypothetical protein
MDWEPPESQTFCGLWPLDECGICNLQFDNDKNHVKKTFLIKVRNSFLLLGVAGIVIFCSKKEVVSLPASASATVKGAPFTPSVFTSTDTGAGLSIELADDSQIITIGLSGKTDNSYVVGAASNFTVAALVRNHVVYYASAGTVTMGITAEGKVSGIFDIQFTSRAGESIFASGGKFDNLPIQTVPSTCRIKQIAFTSSASSPAMRGYIFFYNDKSKISRAVSADISYSFFYDTDGKLAAISSALSQSTYTHEFVYEGALLKSSSLKTTGFSAPPTSYDFNYTYTGSIISGVTTVVKVTGGSTLTNVYALTYTNGNVTAVDGTTSIAGGSSGPITLRYNTFDARKNPYALLAKSTGTSISFDYGGPWDAYMFFSLNANNYMSGGGANTFTYSYTAQNYPSQIVHTNGGLTETIGFVYEGCE